MHLLLFSLTCLFHNYKYTGTKYRLIFLKEKKKSKAMVIPAGRFEGKRVPCYNSFQLSLFHWAAVPAAEHPKCPQAAPSASLMN